MTTENSTFTPFNDEREGQKTFFETYLPRVDSSLRTEDILNDYADGVVRGTLLEFKLTITDLNAVLFQAIKYLSSMRIKGKPLPRNILLVSLNTRTAYLYDSSNYLSAIERVYIGGASKDNAGFVGKDAKRVFIYSHERDEEAMIAVLRSTNYTKIHLDEDCIVGWATTYYRLYPQARKADFIGDQTGKMKMPSEIRKPDKFKDFIYPYEKKTNRRFRYLMDRLNDTLQKKNLGAFYTPTIYAEKALELLRAAIRRVPADNDYIILDRCAGTGNLEQSMTDEELSHVIVSTLEYYEYKVLLNLFGDKVRHIIPPTEREDTFNMGMVRGADALSKEYLDDEVIRQYVDDPTMTIILFENPPYSETTSIEHQRQGQGKKSSVWKKSYVVQEMKKEVKGVATNDLGNAFIWSAFRYYLRQATDSYIVFSPVKYWKAQHLINKEFFGGFAFNRKHFHTTIDACIMVAAWGGQDATLDSLEIDGYDIKNFSLVPAGMLKVPRIHSIYSQQFYDKRIEEDDIQGGILAEFSGKEASKNRRSIRLSPITNDNIIGYLVVKGANFDNPDSCVHLLRVGAYDGNGFYLRADNYLEKLPMFAASRYITYNRAWTERARIMKSADGAEAFLRDVESGSLRPFLLKCLLFTVLEPQNHMRSFTGSDGRQYVNPLCLDTTHGDTIAARDLREMTPTEEERALLSLWERILAAAKKTRSYNPSLTYGLYQIKDELNTWHKDEKTDRKVYDDPQLNGDICSLKNRIKVYYNREIVPVLFKYEFLK